MGSIVEKMYSKTTKKINISVEPFYLEEQSEPDESHFVWAYKIIINNKGEETVKLVNRYWKIIDSGGNSREVKGPGVVGEQPTLKPGEQFEYTSSAPLNTPSGFMSGHYEMTNNNGSKFEVEIPLFSLDSPYESNQKH
tara:strand:+ start:170 stop:583 length:414 start_codon:yes stop_codon:yes gene_type:complete